MNRKPGLTPNEIDFLLWHQNNILGTLQLFYSDWPWELCYFTPAQACETVRPVFEELQRLSFDAKMEEEHYDQLEDLRLTIDNLNFEVQSTKTGERQQIFHFNENDKDEAGFKMAPVGQVSL